jgi:hypothetical protein
MTMKKRVTHLEKTTCTRSPIPRAERVQVLDKGETFEEREAKVIEKYGTSKGVMFVRIKGRS